MGYEVSGMPKFRRPICVSFADLGLFKVTMTNPYNSLGITIIRRRRKLYLMIDSLYSQIVHNLENALMATVILLLISTALYNSYHFVFPRTDLHSHNVWHRCPVG